MQQNKKRGFEWLSREGSHGFIQLGKGNIMDIHPGFVQHLDVFGSRAGYDEHDSILRIEFLSFSEFK